MVNDLFEAYGDNFIPIFCHLGGEAGSGGASSRANFYELRYTPYLWLNGVDDAGYDYSQWERDLAAHQGQETDVTIDILTKTEGPLLRVSATVCIEDGGVGRDMRIYIAQVLDNFPESPTYYRNALRQVQNEVVTVEAGQCVEVPGIMVLPDLDLGRPEDYGVVVWAQEPLANAPAEVFQAAIGGRRRPISQDSLTDPEIRESNETQGW
ncbi:MAG: hypothetical protein ABFS37_00140 [Acidobacteriota bacterium]